MLWRCGGQRGADMWRYAANWYFTDQLWDNRKYASPFTLQDLYGNGNYTSVKPLQPEPVKPPRPQAEIARPPWMKNP
ncbi:uncharacterized protein G2W53_001915 [Senna tora]|uniref:Uncharacterized protein n=1 Tax=Senna tora TaxID=362788 RepID=A0A834XGM7_9FABA|nr:uncharacterized protein G2W53_001908 [Senna tora]KAF7845010.1 uncharacterized protein G2W53_001915 [Senna tora]